mgnify:CR=1 FL=1
MIKTVVQQILLPLAKVMLRFGVSHQSFVEWSKIAFIEAARQSDSIKNKKQPNTAISIITGLHRKEVQRLMSSEPDQEGSSLNQTNRLLRVVQGWLRDTDFSTSGKPMLLPYEGKNSFTELNRRYSGDMKPKAMLDELEKNGMVSVDENKKVKLLSMQFIPKSDIGKMEILGFDAAAMIQTINRNLDLQSQESLFQKKVYYDNLPKNILPEFKNFVNQKSMLLLIELDQFLKKYDGDLSGTTIEPKDKVGAGVGIFYFDKEAEVSK